MIYTWENVDRKDLRYRLFSPVRRICLNRAAAVVAGSRDAARVVQSRGYRRTVYVTPLLGVSEDLFRPRDHSEQRVGLIPHARNKFLIGCISRFAEQKDIATLLNAVARLVPHAGVDWRLVLVGGGPEKARYEELIRRLGIGERVAMHAPVSHEAVPSLMNCFDVLVLPSKTTGTWKEQFGHVLIEAMACGVPVVGSSSGEIPNVIGDAGLVFEETNVADLAQKLAALHADPSLRRALGARGIERVRRRYTDARIAENAIAVCERVLGIPPSGTPNTLEEVTP